MKEKHIKNQGFSLIELIIVVSILAILVGILAPQYVKYVEKSRTAACQADMNTLIKEYQVEVIEYPPATISSAQQLLKKIVDSHQGKVISNGDNFYTGGQYSGLCRKNGIYSCMITKDFMSLSIDCSVHGENVLDIKTLKERLSSVTFTDITGFPYANLDEYLKNHTELNSEATNTDNAYGEYGSLANAVGIKLKQQGINTTNKSWRIYKDTKSYNLFLTDSKITVNDIGKTVACTRYDIEKGEVIKGTVQIIQKLDNKGIPILSSMGIPLQNNLKEAKRPPF